MRNLLSIALALPLLCSLAPPAFARQDVSVDPDAELAPEDRAALRDEREAAELRRRRGDARAAIALYDQHLSDEPRDVESRALRALARRDNGDLRGAWEDVAAAFEQAFPQAGTALGGAEARARVARIALELGTERGRADELEPRLQRGA
ncbi:MAG: hypothetical protein FJ299_07280, partial [Planctomycetes bacterium]|nr:hypothetical protein [Planctomycetota bacterium]